MSIIMSFPNYSIIDMFLNPKLQHVNYLLMQATLLAMIQGMNHSSLPDAQLTSFWIRKHLLGWVIFIETILAELSLHCNIEIKVKDMLSKGNMKLFTYCSLLNVAVLCVTYIGKSTVMRTPIGSMAKMFD